MKGNIAFAPPRQNRICFASYASLLVWYVYIIAYIPAFVQYRKTIVTDSRNLLCLVSFLCGMRFVYIMFFLCFHYFCIETQARAWYNGINPYERKEAERHVL